MIRSLIFLGAFIISYSLSGQGSPSSKGQVYQVAEEGNNPILWGTGWFSFFTVDRDTVIDAKTYNVIAFSGTGDPSAPNAGQYYARTDNGQLFFRFDTVHMGVMNPPWTYNTDILIMDYTLQVGDTLAWPNTIHGEFIVLNVDTTIVNGTPRIRISDGYNVYIEGISSAKYPLSPFFDEWHYSNNVVCITDTSGNLFYEPWVDLDPTDKRRCGYLLGQEEVEGDEVLVYSDDEGLIIRGFDKDVKIVQLLHLDGRLAQEWTFYGDPNIDGFPLALQDHPKGYYVVLINEQQAFKLLL